MKKERIRNRVTGEYEEPDENLMREVERLLEVKGDPTESRGAMIGGIAAWAIDHPGARVDTAVVFPQHLRHMRDVIFGERRGEVAACSRDLVLLLREEGSGLDAGRRRSAEAMLARMKERFGYCENCAGDAASTTLRKRFGDLVV